MMKVWLVLCLMVAFMVSPTTAQAELQNLGEDSLGNRLIYDTDLDITWYDFTNTASTWQSQVDWTEALAVTFGDSVYVDWRLPTTVDGQYATLGYNGSTFSGWNITTSEMGHLYYGPELGNTGSRDVLGSWTGCGGSGEPTCFVGFGEFLNLQSGRYWSTDHAGVENYAWHFDTSTGSQYVGPKGNPNLGVAVHSGMIVPAEGAVATELRSLGRLKAQYR